MGMSVKKSKEKSAKGWSASGGKKSASKSVKSKGEKIAKTYSVLRGMRDILPKEERYWKKLYHSIEDLGQYFQYGRIETPLLEEASLFVRSVGKGTDVVDKEMYLFEDKDGSKVCLRPEMTASMARSYIENGMQALPQPVKVWYHGQMFRHDRPQAGRFRQFYQSGCETIGDSGPVVDAELISVAYNTLRDLGIDTVVNINSIGTLEDRQNYIVELVGYLRSKRSYLSEESKKRINKNPLRVLDSKEKEDIEVMEEAPQILDWLSPESKKFFTDVLEYLDEAEIPYVLNPKLVRGLDYYSNTVFEFYCEEEEKARKEAELSPIKEVRTNKIFFAQLGEQANKKALYILESLRREGLTVYHNLAKSSLKAQMEMANKIGTTHTLILGQKEVQDGSILVRNMDSGIQEVVDQKKIANFVRKLLQN